MPFSAVSEAIVLFSVPAVFWHMMMIQTVGRAPVGWIVAVGAVMLAWTAYAASAFFFGFTSAATPIQLFAFDNPNRVIEYPLGLIPMFLVPYAIIAHLLSIAQLRRDRRSRVAAGSGREAVA